MNQWPNDTNHLQNGHATLGPTPGFPMSFPQQPQTINPAQFQNQPYLNGAARTASPAFHQPMQYQTNQVIPSKRSREDSLGASPRQPHIAPPGSRAQTPGQGPFPGYNPQANGAPPFTSAPTAFAHLQTSSNATPSPTMQQMAFAQAGAAQRVSTASPSPFSPQHNMASASPGASDRASRVGTPHDAPQNFMQNPSAGFNPQHFGPNMMGQMSMNQMNMGHHRMPSGAMDPAQLYQRQLQQHLARQGQGTANGMSPGSQGQMGVKEHPPEQSGMPQPRMSQQPSPSEFFRGLQQFCAAKGRPLEMRPQICGRHVDAMRLYQALQRGGGSHRISKLNQWHLVAQALQLFQPQECRQAGMELQQYWMQNIGAFEQMWIQNQKMKQAQMPGQNSPPHDGQQVNNIPNHRRGPSDVQQISTNGKPPNQMNGLTPSKDPHEHFTSHQRQSQSEQLDALQTEHPADQTQQRPPSAVKQEPEVESTMPFQKPIEDPFLPEVMSASRNHGPIDVEEIFSIGQHLIEMKPVVPSIRELGVVDIHALTMAIKSGMHGETRNALDTLVTLSSEPSLQIQLDLCDDLMETLVDCAQVELEFLADHASEVSDEVSLSSYEELVRSCNVEARTLQPIPAFGSLAYDLDRAADRLICITTLIRNFSFYEPNFATLGQQDVVQLVTRVIQHIGTKDMPLRTSRNTLDFMKDIIIYFSNLSSSLHLPSRQDALCVLHFLLTFAPAPPPILPNSDRIAFASYSPSIHKYLPPAVDSIAKLLARDEPNRMYFKAIFVADGRASIPYELLTRTFGLVVSPLPHGSTHLRAQIEARKPFLLQGMLAAEILASLAPGSENNLARSWLQSEDCFAGNMLKMANLLGSQSSSTSNSRQQQSNRNMPSQRGHDDDPLAHGSIVNRAMAVLRLLVNKSRMVDTDGNTNSAGVPSIVVMKKETVLGAMIQKDVDANMLRLFCQYADLED
ncbi:hypothetical protein LTR70_001281 [Exophiala xenobiotica]|uniref:ARID domain-containing protein n=1 Tax=Lithohypha guttulata TaxID=1690604 RepID=A0ABR0KKL5_9EURO|nr:hypothetical protein LTR24_001532 [Lithohypha guttulata]KAK5328256.1 hypothetical protein LTR70_001281 [Exophiala xenobiotica]